MTNDEAAQIEAIRATLMQYTWCGDNGDIDSFVATFAPDALFDIKGQAVYQGIDAINRGVRNGFDNPPEHQARIRAAGRFSHHIASIRIQLVDDSHANAWAYFAVFGPKGPDHWGRYTDKLVRIDGQWKFSHRRVSTDFAVEGSVFYPDGV
jgi:ketosteroid isomerase-like protein